MHEGIPTGPSPEEPEGDIYTPRESKDGIYTPLTLEEQARILWWKELNWTKDDKETEIKSEDLRESGPLVIEWEGTVTSFEAIYSLSELHAITEITPEESEAHRLREPAKEAFCRIEVNLDSLKRETNVSKEKFEELQAKYKLLSQAVGIINKGRVDHTR